MPSGKTIMSINVVNRTDDLVKLQHVLVSVSDKSGLDTFIPGLLEIAPQVRFFSTGGTYGRIKEILGADAEAHLTQVSTYTGQPETQGGLVKTLAASQLGGKELLQIDACLEQREHFGRRCRARDERQVVVAGCR